ncbi:trypsin-like serine peptidase [Streptomyces sp. NPDC054865]
MALPPTPEPTGNAMPQAKANTWTAKEAQLLLTAERMATARPWPTDDLASAPGSPAGGELLGDLLRPALSEGPKAGAIFRIGKDTVHFCSASVVSSPQRNLVVTSTDCVSSAPTDEKLVFVPTVRKNAKGAIETPDGLFPVQREADRNRVWTDPAPARADGSAKAAPGTAFALVGNDANDKELEEVVPGFRLLTGSARVQEDVRLAAHPGSNAQACVGTTSAVTSGAPAGGLRLDCPTELGTFTAGAALIARYEAAGGTGGIIGVAGARGRDTQPADTAARSVYSPYFGSDVQELYEEAVRGSKPAVPAPATPEPIGPSTSAPSTPSSPSPTAAGPEPKASGTGEPPTGGELKATPEQIAAAKRAEAYWTPERIASAVPVDDGKPAGASPERGAVAGAPSHFDNRGVATVGVFLITEDDDPQSDPAARPQFCTASSVTSPTKSIVMTAAHCLSDNDRFKHLAFVPGWKPDPANSSRGIAPYGVFPIQEGKVYIDGRYLTLGPVKGDDLDFAFLRSGPNAKGQFLEDATGTGNKLTTIHFSELAQKNVSLIGFPGSSKAPLLCGPTTTSGYSDRFLKIACNGYDPGVSGGPFLRNFDGKRGEIIGVIGGYKTGGPTPDISYSSQFDGEVTRLFNQAVNNEEPDQGTRSDLGSAGLWKHAVGAASGTFHTSSQQNGDSDLIVRWDDGEVTLYPGDQNFSFYNGCQRDMPCETQLAKPNDLFKKYADLITAGDYAGGAAYDLLVKWVDGEVTIYPDIDQNTKLPTSLDQHLPNEITVAPANSVWKYARGIATGKYAGNRWPDDLIVRWSDGEITKYVDVDGDGLHAEEQLAAPNDLWQSAALITGGDFDGDSNDTTPNHDLMVIWASGKVSVYADVRAGGVQSESVVSTAEGNGTWAHARVIAAGEYGMNDWEDDFFVRWSDGEVTMYGNTQASAMGREYVLVPPSPLLRGVAPASPAVGGRPEDPCAVVCGPELYRSTH